MVSTKCFIFLCLASAVSPVSGQAAIFGSDDRADLIPGSPFTVEGRATAVAVLSANISPDEASPGTFKIEPSSLTDYMCPGERFAKDPSLSYACSGFLVAPDLLVTAGHCMANTGEVRDEPEMYCEAYGWLFDFQKNARGETATRAIPAENYYKCKKILFAVKDEEAPYRDYALVQLERPVVNRTPLKLADPAKKISGSLHMIGFPFGTPMKLTRNGMVLLDNLERGSLITNLDAFEGNSGSAVLNSSNEVVGILVAGTPSLSTYTPKGESCQRYNRCDAFGNTCTLPDTDTAPFIGFQRTGSEVQRIAPIVEMLNAL